MLRAIIRRIWEENHRVYGPRKVWEQMGRADLHEARRRVRCLMREMGLAGAARESPRRSRPPRESPAEYGRSALYGTRPNQLWVADFTYVESWRGFVYVAFVIDVFARRIVGWRVSS